MTESKLNVEYVRRLEEALAFYGDPETYFALAVFPDHPCGPFYWDMDESAGHPDLDGPRYGAFARASLRNEDYDPPLDFSDFQERYPELYEQANGGT